MDGGPGQQGLLAAVCLESDEQPTRNEDKAPELGVASEPCASQQLQSGKKPEASNPGLSALEHFETFLSSPA
ncbi:unnamed protein product [Rangifer tarandus platyrhynchus]|uniref:Uncharacterized protein n=1 Tax=Rangifer tarandus platyrhynchus TaxID=3082113 RepID=A0AC59YT44_RANTA